MNYDWQWSAVWDYRYALLNGVSWTLVLTIVSILIGSALGLLWGVFLASRDYSLAPIRAGAFLIADVIRALPLLVLLLFANYYLPPIIGIHSTFWISVIALSLNLSAFIADVLRGAIRGVARPLIEAALAVGMTQRQSMRRIVLPEALRQVVPTFALLYIDILKMSSLASVIAFQELTHVGGEISAKTYRPLEVIASIAVIYIVLVLPLAYLQRRLEIAAWFTRRS
jgi:polar amino acid transport system permease protein